MLRGPNGRLAIKCVTLLKHCINWNNNIFMQTDDDICKVNSITVDDYTSFFNSMTVGHGGGFGPKTKWPPFLKLVSGLKLVRMTSSI